MGVGVSLQLQKLATQSAMRTLKLDILLKERALIKRFQHGLKNKVILNLPVRFVSSVLGGRCLIYFKIRNPELLERFWILIPFSLF